MSGKRWRERKRRRVPTSTSDSAADDLWRALSRSVIGRHVASQCGNESIRVGTRERSCVDGNFPTDVESKQPFFFPFATWREKKRAESSATAEIILSRATSDVNNAVSQRVKKEGG